jgi:DNA modification methylase
VTAKSYLGGKVVVHGGDCLDVLRRMESCSVDSVVTDPPYALVSIGKRFGADGAAPPKDYAGGSGVYQRASAGFMGKQWDTGERAFREGMSAILIEREPEYLADIERRMQLVLAGPVERRQSSIKARGKTEHAGPLFALAEAAE